MERFAETKMETAERGSFSLRTMKFGEHDTFLTAVEGCRCRSAFAGDLPAKIRLLSSSEQIGMQKIPETRRLLTAAVGHWATLNVFDGWLRKMRWQGSGAGGAASTGGALSDERDATRREMSSSPG